MNNNRIPRSNNSGNYNNPEWRQKNNNRPTQPPHPQQRNQNPNRQYGQQEQYNMQKTQQSQYNNTVNTQQNTQYRTQNPYMNTNTRPYNPSHNPPQRPKQQNQSGNTAKPINSSNVNLQNQRQRQNYQAGNVKPVQNQKPTAIPKQNKKPPSRKLSPEERKIQITKKRELLKKRLINSLILFLKRFIIYIIVTLLLFGVSAAFFFINLNSNGNLGNVTYTIGYKHEIFLSSEKRASELYYYKNYYVNMTDVALYCSMVTTGNSKQLRYILNNETNDNVRFVLNSGLIYINNIPLRLTVPVIWDDGNVYVPLEFIERYMNGMKAEAVIEKKSKSIIVERVLTDESYAAIDAYEKLSEKEKAKTTLPEIIYTELSFNLRSSESSKNIPEHSIGDYLLELTNPIKEPPQDPQDPTAQPPTTQSSATQRQQ